MNAVSHLKIIRQIIGQTPLIINPERDAPRFQGALAGLSDAKLESFYRELTSEERRRFHYVANLCLGYESWCKVYQNLVVQSTRERLADSMESAYASRLQELTRREADLEGDRLHAGEQIMALEAETIALRRANERLAGELQKVQGEKGLLLEQQKQMQEMMERYRRLIAELKGLLGQSTPLPAKQQQA